MKKSLLYLITAILLSAFILLISSCGDAPAEEKVSVSDMYFVWDSHRINAATGAVTHLCPDPLCEHTIDACPYYRIFTQGNANLRTGQYFVYLGQVLVEDPNSITMVKEIPYFSSYDITNNQVTRQYSLDGQGGRRGSYSYSCYDHYVFLEVAEAPAEIENPTAEDYEFKTVIIDLTDNSQKLCPVFGDRMQLLHYDGESVYYIDWAHNYHILDVASGNNQIVPFDALPEELRAKGYYYYFYDPEASPQRGINYMNAKGEAQLIVPDGYGYQIRDNDIIYIKYDSSVQGDRHSWDIWACDLDGSNPRLLFENPGNIKFYSSINYDAQLAGDYFGIECTEYITNEAGETVPLHSISDDGYTSFLIIDTTTGNYKTAAVYHKQPESYFIPAQ